MTIFKNPFFSSAGQAERLENVGNTLLAAVGIKKGGVQGNTKNKSLNSALSVVASHPFATAGFAAGGVNPSGAVAAARAAGGAVASSFSKASLGTKAAVVVSVPVIAGALTTSPKLATDVANAPGSLANFGRNIGRVAESPGSDSLARLVKENPVLAGGTIAGAALLAGGAVTGALSTIATRQNTKAIISSTSTSPPPGTLTESSTALYPTSPAGGSNLVAPVTDSNVKTPILSSPTPIGTRKRKRKPIKASPNITQNVKVYNIDDRDVSDRKVYKRGR